MSFHLCFLSSCIDLLRSQASALFVSLQHFVDIVARIGGVDLRHLLGRALRDHRAASVAALGAHIDDIVGCLDHIQIVFNDHDRVPALHQLMEDRI